jgi:hypothetical protein
MKVAWLAAGDVLTGAFSLPRRHTTTASSSVITPIRLSQWKREGMRGICPLQPGREGADEMEINQIFRFLASFLGGQDDSNSLP